MAEDDAFVRKFAELSATFRAQLPQRLVELEAFADAGDIDALRDVAHRLAGQGGTFGAPEVTAAAFGVEAAAPTEVRRALDALRAAAGSVG